MNWGIAISVNKYFSHEAHFHTLIWGTDFWYFQSWFYDTGSQSNRRRRLNIPACHQTMRMQFSNWFCITPKCKYMCITCITRKFRVNQIWNNFLMSFPSQIFTILYTWCSNMWYSQICGGRILLLWRQTLPRTFGSDRLNEQLQKYSF